MVGVIAAAVFPSCREHSVNTPVANPHERVHLSYSHADSVEAGELACWYSATIRPSDSLISEVLYSLNYLRYVFDDSLKFHDSVSVLRQWRFLAPFRISQIIIECDDATTQAIFKGTYHAWTGLDSFLRPVEYRLLDSSGFFLLKFDGFSHPLRLVRIFRSLPGIIYGEPNYVLFAGWSTFPIYPWYDGKNWSYVFCPGDARGPYWYLKYNDGMPEFIGSLLPGDSLPEPWWWEEARVNISQLYGWDGPQ